MLAPAPARTKTSISTRLTPAEDHELIWLLNHNDGSKKSYKRMTTLLNKIKGNSRSDVSDRLRLLILSKHPLQVADRKYSPLGRAFIRAKNILKLPRHDSGNPASSIGEKPYLLPLKKSPRDKLLGSLEAGMLGWVRAYNYFRHNVKPFRVRDGCVICGPGGRLPHNMPQKPTPKVFNVMINPDEDPVR